MLLELKFLVTMGNACCGANEERPKASAFTSSADASSIDQTAGGSSALQQQQQQQQQNQHSLDQGSSNIISNVRSATPGADTAEVDKETSEEESRLELLVQTAGRAMVAVRSTRGSNPYYDQGFAAALAQHLEQTTQFPPQKPVLPAAPSAETSVYTRLSQPLWDDLQLGTQGGLAGCAGENPEKYLDRVAESFLDQVVPKKEQLFTKTKPIVESLL